MAKKILIAFFLSIYFLSICVFANAQNRKDSLEKIKNLIIEHNTVTTPGIGEMGYPSNSWFQFAYMVYLSTNKELVSYTMEKNSALKAYAYLGLVRNKYSDTLKIFNQLNKNQNELIYRSCPIIPTTVKEWVLTYKNTMPLNTLNKVVELLRKDEVFRNKLFKTLALNKGIDEAGELAEDLTRIIWD